MAQPSPDTIAGVPLFAGLNRRALERIANSFKERRFPAGSSLSREGQSGAGFFIIAEGTGKVAVGGEERGSLGPGDYFGEIALIDEGVRSATITAETDMTCYGLTPWEFRPIVESDSSVAWKLLQALAQKVRAAEQRG